MSINDLMELLTKIRDEHGNLEVMDSYDEEIVPEVVEGVLVICDKA